MFQLLSYRGLGAIAVASLVSAACGDEAIVGASGTVTLGIEQGVEFIDGTTQSPGNYRDSDLIARKSGTNISLATGGSSPTESRPINWFRTDGGVLQRFDTFDAVPSDRPDDTMTTPNLAARAGHGFVVLTSRGTFTRGFIEAADGTSVTITFAHSE
jgi:hypothetical protein